MKNNFRSFLIFRENKLSSTNFRKKNYTLYHNYKININSHTSHEFATSFHNNWDFNLPYVKIKLNKIMKY